MMRSHLMLTVDVETLLTQKCMSLCVNVPFVYLCVCVYRVLFILEVEIRILVIKKNSPE